MISGALPLKLLVPLFLVYLVRFTDGGKLDFYQDVEPQPQPEDVMYKRVARYFESENEDPREVHRTRLPPWKYDEYLEYKRQKEKAWLEALPSLVDVLENPGLVDLLENQKQMKDREQVVQQWPQRYDNRDDYSRVIDDAAPAPRIFDGFTKDLFNNEKPYYARAPAYPLRFERPEISENFPLGDVDVLQLQEKLMAINDNRRANSEQDRYSSSQITGQEPEFTFKFDQPKINERDTFAIKPNDPRYYADDDDDDNDDEETRTTSGVVEKTTATKAKVVIEADAGEAIVDDQKSNVVYDDAENARSRDRFSLMKFEIPEVERRADRDPLVVTTNRMTNNDIYFIAIVAGCSAACMFALVLIALTWCRLQRGAKAAADIEYPAYGVTGPNKDISPSGDQRLAHSAQMYHFQHQKQQIIAMESRTAASRDPGSVSEAESDEENEEGDYTVYECPGLAPTGEMEVKNPMFHDDPTPATPPQIHKEEDHI